MKATVLTKNGYEVALVNEIDKIDYTVLKDITQWIWKYLEPARISNFDYKVNSYTLKHVCEASIKKYVSNGELIAAMIECGFFPKRKDLSDINCNFRVDSKIVSYLRRANL